ncbi:MAG: flagellar hook-length control protein FliK [Azospirillaceae bacterium]|nr:flagellar hook-length control protein FliK [Azospirillaceae bacterium]
MTAEQSRTTTGASSQASTDGTAATAATPSADTAVTTGLTTNNPEGQQQHSGTGADPAGTGSIAGSETGLGSSATVAAGDATATTATASSAAGPTDKIAATASSAHSRLADTEAAGDSGAAATTTGHAAGVSAAGATGADLGLSAGATSSSTASQTTAANTTTTPSPNSPAVEQVAFYLQKAVTTKSNQVTITLNPEDLGSIEIKLKFGGNGSVQASVTASNPETLQMLKHDSHILEQSLQNAGLQTDGNSLSFDLQQGGGFSQGNSAGDGGSGRQTSGYRQAAASLSATTDAFAAATTTATRSATLGSGRLDIRC